MKKQTLKINETQFCKIIKESIKNVLSAKARLINEDYTEYGHDLNDIMLSIENDRDIYDRIMLLVKSLTRKKMRGVTIDFDTLLNSQVISRLVNDSLNIINSDRVKRGDTPYQITPDEKQKLKNFLAKNVFDRVEE